MHNTSKCFPSRAALLTGLYPQQSGMDRRPGKFSDGIFFGEVLCRAGYRTLFVGKHHGTDNPFDWALELLEDGRDSGKPFCLYVSYQAPHDPLQAHERDIAKYKVRYDHTPAHFIDIMPTLVEIAGADYPASYRDKTLPPLPGVSLLPLLRGDSIERPDPIYFQWGNGRAVITPKWKLVSRKGDQWELYEHDALLIASPEYNSMITAALKNAIDWVSRADSEDEAPLSAIAGKKAAILSASPGGYGGSRSLGFLREFLGNIKVEVIEETFSLAKAHEAFDEDGSLKDDEAASKVRAVGRALAEAS